jgi:hypothetical protein
LFSEERSELLDERKESKLQWLHGSNQKYEGHAKSVRLETSRSFRKKKRKYLKEKINEL